jgi:hypothetical protein
MSLRREAEVSPRDEPVDLTITDPRGNVTAEKYFSGLRFLRTKGSGTPSAATWVYRYDPAALGSRRH